MTYQYYFLFIFALLIGISCTTPERESSSDYIIKWEGISVDSLVFKSQYIRYVSTASVYDSPELRKEFARQLLERKIIADKATEFRFDTLTHVQNEISRAKEIALAKYFIRSKVEPKISKPAEKEIREAFERANTRVRLQQIFAPNQVEIDKYYKQLSENPDKFNELAERSMIAANELPETYDMGWVEWNKMDLEPEKKAFNLEIGEFSEPVQSLVGWHIFKAIDRNQTFYADNTTYQNAKEALSQTIERRRFEEQSVQYIDSVLRATELIMYPENARLLWNYLSTKLPRDKNEIQQVLTRESDIFKGLEIPSDLTLAVLNGKPVTVKDFMKRLPNIPHWQFKPDMRSALETVLKDKLFAEKAIEEGFEKHPQVLKEIEITRVSALNTSMVSTVSDTLNLDRFSDIWYQKRKNNFIKNSQRIIESYSFESEEKARTALEQFKIEQNWKTVLDDYRDSFLVSYDTLWSDKDSNHPAFQINLNPQKYGEFLLWGPYEINNSSSFIRLLSVSNSYFSIDESQGKLNSLMENKRRLIARDFILKETKYLPSEINYNEELLKNILPFYF